MVVGVALGPALAVVATRQLGGLLFEVDALENLNLRNYGHLLRWKSYADLLRGRPSEALAILNRARSDYAASG